MLPIALSLLLAITFTRAAPVEQDNLAFAAEVLGSVTPQQMSCLRDANYRVALVEAYTDGQFIPDSIPNAWFAVTTGMGVEIYMTPNALHSKTAKQQVDETIQGLISKGLTIKQLWVKITDVSKWTPSIMFNDNFLGEVMAAINAHGRKVGIITNSAAFYEITPGLGYYMHNVKLWYGNSKLVTCDRVEENQTANFNDFKSFADWTKPDAKECCVGRKLCDITVNSNVVSKDSIWTPPS
ncbi:hypothetical protein RB195_016660 [Necator americanus]|uniref:Uncharacterized protein n=1 Tax=Necator americanus TaxID=51031 RepID=A0ABR1C1I2_NECAM